MRRCSSRRVVSRSAHEHAKNTDGLLGAGRVLPDDGLLPSLPLSERRYCGARHQVGLPDIPYFKGAPVFQPQSPASRNEAIREMKSPVFKLGPLTSHHYSTLYCSCGALVTDNQNAQTVTQVCLYFAMRFTALNVTILFPSSLLGAT